MVMMYFAPSTIYLTWFFVLLFCTFTDYTLAAAQTSNSVAPKHSGKECGSRPQAGMKNLIGKDKKQWQACIKKSCGTSEGEGGAGSDPDKLCPNKKSDLCGKHCLPVVNKKGELVGGCCSQVFDQDQQGCALVGGKRMCEGKAPAQTSAEQEADAQYAKLAETKVEIGKHVELAEQALWDADALREALENADPAASHGLENQLRDAELRRDDALKKIAELSGDPALQAEALNHLPPTPETLQKLRDLKDDAVSLRPAGEREPESLDVASRRKPPDTNNTFANPAPSRDPMSGDEGNTPRQDGETVSSSATRSISPAERFEDARERYRSALQSAERAGRYLAVSIDAERLSIERLDKAVAAAAEARENAEASAQGGDLFKRVADNMIQYQSESDLREARDDVDSAHKDLRSNQENFQKATEHLSLSVQDLALAAEDVGLTPEYGREMARAEEDYRRASLIVDRANREMSEASDHYLRSQERFDFASNQERTAERDVAAFRRGNPDDLLGIAGREILADHARTDADKEQLSLNLARKWYESQQATVISSARELGYAQRRLGDVMRGGGILPAPYIASSGNSSGYPIRWDAIRLRNSRR